MTFSIGSWSFHRLYETGQMSVFGYIESLSQRYRVTRADIWNGMLVSTDDAYIDLVDQALRREEIEVACLAVDHADIWHEHPDKRAHQHQVALRYLEIARKLRVKTLRIDMGVMSPDMTDEQFTHLVDRYRQYTAVAHDWGFRIGPQTHQPGSLVATNLTRLQQALNTPAFGVLLDVGRWPHAAEESDLEVAPYTMHVHFDRAFIDLFGDALPRKVKLLQEAGYNGCWSLESRAGEHEYLNVAQDLAAVRRAVSIVIG